MWVCVGVGVSVCVGVCGCGCVSVCACACVWVCVVMWLGGCMCALNNLNMLEACGQSNLLVWWNSRGRRGKNNFLEPV